jgi:hypothetical protein
MIPLLGQNIVVLSQSFLCMHFIKSNANIISTTCHAYIFNPLIPNSNKIIRYMHKINVSTWCDFKIGFSMPLRLVMQPYYLIVLSTFT